MYSLHCCHVLYCTEEIHVAAFVVGPTAYALLYLLMTEAPPNLNDPLVYWYHGRRSFSSACCCRRRRVVPRKEPGIAPEPNDNAIGFGCLFLSIACCHDNIVCSNHLQWVWLSYIYKAAPSVCACVCVYVCVRVCVSGVNALLLCILQQCFSFCLVLLFVMWDRVNSVTIE